MKLRYLMMLPMLAAQPAQAADAEGLMRELAWQKRVLLIFAPHGQHAGYRRQLALLDPVAAGLRERDTTVIGAFARGRVVVDGQARELAAFSFYRRFAVEREAFRVILVGKDGTVKLDRDDPVASDVLFTLIDAMPMRRLEMGQQNRAAPRLQRVSGNGCITAPETRDP